MHDITKPLQLAVGSHQAGSGKGCAMNVISWENGDTEITDYPECADQTLAWIVQCVNDAYCRHTEDRLLCPPCSAEVLDLAHKTVGTAGACVDTSLNGLLNEIQYLSRRLTGGHCLVGEQREWARSQMMGIAHRVLDEVRRFNGLDDATPAPEVVADAVARMREVSV